MTGFQIFVEWLATFIEVVFYFSIVHVLAPEQFKRKKQIMMFLVITSIITTGVILLNFIDLSFSLTTIIYSAFAMSFGACILFQGNNMNLAQIIKTELYKNSQRKSSLILFIPMLLAVLVTLGYAHGVIELNLTSGDAGIYFCMDFVFIVWNVLSGLGIIGILMILFAAFQFSGEIERGQIKFMLLRTGKRSTVVLGKYLTTVIMTVVFIAGILFVSIGSYYLFISGSSMGTGTFASTMDGFSTMNIWCSIALQMIMYLFLIGITFLTGLFVNPFVTFILTLVNMYVGNYLAGTENTVSKLLPNYWSNQMALNKTVKAIPALTSVLAIAVLTLILLSVTIMLFQKQDVK